MSKLLLGIALLFSTGCATRVPCYEAIGAVPGNVLLLDKCYGEVFFVPAPPPPPQPTPHLPEHKPEI